MRTAVSRELVAIEIDPVAIARKNAASPRDLDAALAQLPQPCGWTMRPNAVNKRPEPTSGVKNLVSGVVPTIRCGWQEAPAAAHELDAARNELLAARNEVGAT